MSRAKSDPDAPAGAFETSGLLRAEGSSQRRLAFVVDMMREISRQTDPQKLVETYGRRVREILPWHRFISLSRRGLPARKYRVTRTSMWDRKDAPNPWKQPDRLPVLEGGLLGELIYGDEPVIIDDLRVADGDPGAEYLAGMRSVVAIPLYDQGVALNMVVQLHKDPAAFPAEQLAEEVWTSNLFGRATHNLVLRDQVKQAYDA